jgi:hypothetical protein
MARALRVIRPGDGADADPTCTMEEALADLTARVAADRPSVVLIVWEVAGTDEVRMCSLPSSFAVRKGLVCEAYDMIFPDEKADPA